MNLLQIKILLVFICSLLINKSDSCLPSNPFRSSSDNQGRSVQFPYGKNTNLENGITRNFEVGGFVPSTDNPHRSQNQFNSQLLVDVTPPSKNHSLGFVVTVRNQGEEDEYVQMSVYNSEGKVMPIFPSEFPLASGSSAEIPLTLTPFTESRSLSHPDEPRGTSDSPKPLEGLVTIHARGKRDSVQRSFVFENQIAGEFPIEPFCFDKDVSGTCRYRTDPEDCFRWDWTAYATILNQGGNLKISSIPEGIFVRPGEHGRVRVYLKVSCCTPIVQFISTDSYFQTGVNSCVVDVRELQALHPGEIAAIVIAVILLIIIIIVVIILCCRKRRTETLNVGMLPRERRREVFSPPLNSTA